MWKHRCWSHFLTTLQVSMPEILLKKDSGTGIIFLRIFRSFSKNLIYKTSPDDCSCWFLRYNQSFIHWSHFVFSSLFFFIIDNCNHGSLLRKCLKMKKTFFTFYSSLFKNWCRCCYDNLTWAIICRRTLQKIQISFGKTLGNCWMLRRISKAEYLHEIGCIFEYNFWTTTC